MSTFRLPDLGEGLQEAEIVAWHVSVGDHVVADQPLVSVETDKAVVEIPSPQSGRIARLFGKPGDVVPVGGALVDYESGEAAPSETVVGELPHEAAAVRAEAGARKTGVKAAPAVRQLAQDLGVDVNTLAGSGPAGTVTAGDVSGAAGAQAEGARSEGLRGPRRAMAQAMTNAGAQVVPSTLTDDADVSGWPVHADPTIALLRAVVAGCRAAPALNAWYDAGQQRRTIHQHADIGIAVNTDEGLFVPVVRHADELDAARLRAAVDALKRQVRDRSISPSDLRGQTISLSNFGMLAGRYANLVVIPPQVAILGAGRICDRVLAVDAQPAVRRVMPLSLTFDHRVVTGGEAARFLRAVIDSLQSETGDMP